jgi:hypothetical protein
MELVSGAALFDQAKGSGRAPGDFAFDPLNFSKDSKAAQRYAYIHVYMYKHKRSNIHIYIHIHIYFHVYANTHTHTSTHTPIHVRPYTNAHMHTPTHAHTHRYATNEIKNGRLAMLAFSGIITQAALFPDQAFPFF